MRVLLAEHRAANAEDLFRMMAAAGISIDTVGCAHVVAEKLRSGAYDALVLAAALPDTGGLQLLRQLRAGQNAIPVLILAQDTIPASRIEALQSGADDVVAASLDHEELAARLQAIIRRSQPPEAAVLRIDAMEMNFHTHEVRCHGQPVHLTAKEYTILQFLAQRRGTVLSKDAFLTHLYGGRDEPEAKIIDVFICKLRKKLQLVGVGDLVVTVWGKGYMMREGKADLAATSTPLTRQAA